MEETLSERSIVVSFRPSNGKLFDCSFDPSQMTVLQLKEKLARETNIPADSMRLVYSGRILKDEDMVDSYGVKEGHTIHVVRGAANQAAEQAAANSSSSGGASRYATPSTSSSPASSSSVNPFSNPPPTRQLGSNSNNFEQDLMRGMMNSPMMRQILSNPEIVRSMVMQNPTMRQMIERNPEIGHIINDPSFIRQTMDMARNPELMREMMRNNDRALANLETIPGGFNHLRRMYHTLQEPLESAGRHSDNSSEAANQRLAQMLNVESPPEGQINSTPLPNPWAPRNHNNSGSSSTTTGSSLSQTNPFGGISNFGFGFPGSILNFTTPPIGDRIASTTNQTSTSQTNQTSQANNSSSTPSSTSAGVSTTTPSFSDPDLFRRFQQAMQRYPQYLSRPHQQTFYPTSLFGSPNPFFMNMQQSSFGAAQPTTIQPTEPPEIRFRLQLERLEEMGFVDQAANIRALLAAGGDVNSAIEWLLQNSNS
ncbi:5446_t:CDS:10 [Ambispora leptoticha]|uniref:Ubiquilin n=1 Tax=Ambispora leptoticha TaxID=144679 RepID=A0A9N8W0P5_9GLOM|nr:5446_t:CDS:10 [Ambispora leptoticha]